MRIRLAAMWGAIGLVLVACGGTGGSEPATGSDLCADVVAVTFDVGSDGTGTIAVTVESDDLGWEAYADRWEVVVAGDVVGTRVLTHPHVEEQPFTRSLRVVGLPTGDPVTIRAHHSTGGFCGTELVVEP